MSVLATMETVPRYALTPLEATCVLAQQALCWMLITERAVTLMNASPIMPVAPKYVPTLLEVITAPARLVMSCLLIVRPVLTSMSAQLMEAIALKSA